MLVEFDRASNQFWGSVLLILTTKYTFKLCETDIDQRFGLFDVGRSNDSFHRKLHRFSLLTVEQSPVVFTEMEIGQ